MTKEQTNNESGRMFYADTGIEITPEMAKQMQAGGSITIPPDSKIIKAGFPSLTEQTNSWEEEFDKQFSPVNLALGIIKNRLLADNEIAWEIKQFISKTISQEKEKWVEEIKGMIIHPTEKDTNGYMTGVTKNGERLSMNQMIGYNKAIDDLLQNK